MDIKVIRKWIEGDKYGEDVFADVIVTSGDGNSARFLCANIHDFGYVVNPLYPITRGRRPGGVAVEDPTTGKMVWKDFEGDRWVTVRELTPFEQEAIQFLYEHAPIRKDYRV